MLHLLLVIVELSSVYVTSSHLPNALGQAGLLSPLFVTMDLEKVNFGYSMKNIPIPSEQEYFLEMINAVEVLVHNFRWESYFFLNPNATPIAKETYDFKSTNTAPKVKELKELENYLFELIRDIKFDYSFTNSFQQKLKQDKSSIQKESKVFIAADKTTNFYKAKVETHDSLMTKNVTKDYKKSDPETVKGVINDDKKIVNQLDIDNRVFKTSKREAFVTLKDHKSDFENNPSCRLINPTKPEIGRISKFILQNFFKQVRQKTQFNQWEDSSSAIDWFNRIKTKPKSRFIQFDIKDFYPSITEQLLTEALNWAGNYIEISDRDKIIIFQSKKSFIYRNGEPWNKTVNPDCDITMGSYDGAETCDIVGLFFLSKLQNFDIDIGLYRDDGLCVSTKTPRENDIIKKKITKIFHDYDLTLLFDVVNGTSVNFLDINLNLKTRKFKPYMKPNNIPLYVHKNSNHPPGIKKNIPLSVENRLSKISSDENVFSEAATPYQKALNDSGYDHVLKFNPPQPKAKRNRSRKVRYFNPPYSSSVKTNVGAKFLGIIDKCFPKGHVLNKIFNRNTVKISYKCMPNMKCVISKHNAKILKVNQKNNNPPPCRHRGGNVCPLDGKCKTESLVYKATVICDNSIETYTGLSEPSFRVRYANHQSDFRHPENRGKTTLAGHVWNLKDQNKDPTVNFEILKKARSFNPVNRKCMLCLYEKYFILFNPDGATLNSRSEFFSSCRHKVNKLLSNQKT